MKQLGKLFMSLALLAGICYGQQTFIPIPTISDSYQAGIYYAPNFGQWQLKMASSITATGSQSFTASAGFVTTADGVIFVPFAVNEKISVGLGSTAETVTISAVTGCNSSALPGALTPTCTVTATSFANNHGVGEPITSADSGSIEAIAYASASGGGSVYFLQDCGVITLNTGGLTTTSTCFVPNQFYGQGSASRVTTTITTSASWAVGIVNNTAGFSTAQTTLTAGTTSYGVQGVPAVNLVTGATSANLTAVLITAGTSNAGAGAVHVRVWGYTSAPPAF